MYRYYHAQNKHYISGLHIAEHYRVSNGSTDELRLAKLSPYFWAFQSQFH